MGFHVYMLRCADGSYYVGHTEDLEPRLAAHHDGLFSWIHVFSAAG
jgi:predicted GIY-YIG superfamily endonuclease